MEPIPCSTPKKGDVPYTVATILRNIKQLPLKDMKHVSSTVIHVMKERRIPLGSPSKPPYSSSAHAHDVSLVLQCLIKKEALRTNVPILSSFSGKMAKG